MRTSLRQLALIACLTSTTIAIPNISVKGAKFFADGQQFFLKGVAYQGTPSDPLVDTAQCTFDAESMASIGTNSIRVYHVDPDADHDGCMSVFSDKGIYVWLDLDTFSSAVVQTDPTWTEGQFGNFTKVMDVFQKYDNLAGFWIGNEVINTATGSAAAPYIKAAITDMKTYMASKGYRTIPIGYSAADIAELRPELQNYLACGDDPSQAIDFFGLNSYEWCGQATYDSSGYSNLQAMAEGYSIPMFFSETGCNVGGERTFADQAAIFGPDMVGTWSGSIIYEWVQETNDYGLVTYANGQIYNGSPIPIQPDYDNLASQWKEINPAGVAEGSYSPSFSAPACPGPTNGWLINGNVPLPTLGSAAVQAEVASVKPTTSSSSSAAPTTSSSVSLTTSISTTGSSTLSHDSSTVSSLVSIRTSFMPSSSPLVGSSSISTPTSMPSTSPLVGSSSISTSTSMPSTSPLVGSSSISTSNSMPSASPLVGSSSISNGASLSPTATATSDPTPRTGTSNASATTASNSTSTNTSADSNSTSKSKKNAGTNLGVPVSIAGAMLGLFLMVFL